jgi:RNA polymerase sigma factor (sigma-70 family)
MTTATKTVAAGESLEALVRALMTAREERRERLERQIYDSVAERLVADLVRTYPRLGWHDAEEIVSDALLALLQQPERFDPTRAGLLTYLRLVTSRDAQNLLAKRARRPLRIPLSLVGEDQIEVRPGGPDASPLRATLVRRVEDAIEHLPPRTREMMRLALAGMSITEIAEGLGCSVETIRARRSRGTRAIRAWLAHESQ